MHIKSKWIVFLLLLFQIFMEYILARVTNGKKISFASMHLSVILTSLHNLRCVKAGGRGYKMGNMHKGEFKWFVGEGIGLGCGKSTNERIFPPLKIYSQLFLKKLILSEYKNVLCNKFGKKNKQLGGCLFDT